MRKSVIGGCVGVSLACLFGACGGDDNQAGGTAGEAGSNAGSAGAGGSSTNSGGNAGADGNAGSSPGSGGAGGATAGSGGAGSGGAPTDGGATTATAVYTMSNAAAGNEILGFLRAADGALTPMAAPFPSGGKGSGMGLGEQGAVAYDLARNRIYAVNAGDSSFSVWPVKMDGTLGTVLNVSAAGDAQRVLIGPKSITFHENIVYVLFQGDATTASAISGWTLNETGGVLGATAIAGSTLLLSSDTQSVDPAQIEFSPDGKWLLVTEKQSGASGAVKGSGSIDTFSVDTAGLAEKMGFYPTASAGADAGLQMTPFGFEFYGNYVIVSEAGSTGVGSYTYAGGVIAPVTAASQFLSTDPAPCWVTFSSNFAYVTNARGPSISGFKVGTSGGLSNIGAVANGVVASTGRTLPSDAGLVFQGPTDEFVSIDGKFLYVLNAAVPSIGIFQVQSNGSLDRVGAGDYAPATAAALPAGSAGIVAR